MTQNVHNEGEAFKKTLWASVVFHVVVILFFTVRMAWRDEASIEYQSAVRVDLLALPDLKQPEVVSPAPAPTAPIETPKEKSSPAKTVVEKKASTKNLTQQALKRLEALNKLDKILEDEAPKKNATAKPIKGNILSPGSAIKGISRMEYESYLSELDQHVKGVWLLPEWLAKGDYRAQARIWIDSTGQLLKRELVQSSQNKTYDQLVIEAIERAVPFPAPPEKFQKILAVDGLTLGFPE